MDFKLPFTVRAEPLEPEDIEAEIAQRIADLDAMMRADGEEMNEQDRAYTADDAPREYFVVRDAEGREINSGWTAEVALLRAVRTLYMETGEEPIDQRTHNLLLALASMPTWHALSVAELYRSHVVERVRRNAKRLVAALETRADSLASLDS